MTSKWIKQVAALGAAEVEWGVFSLEIANNPDGAAGVDLEKVRGIPTLRTALLVRDRFGNDAMGRFYSASGYRNHELCESLNEPETLHNALRDCDLDPALFDEANSDPATWAQLVDEHTTLVKETKAFGVPVIRLDDGTALFGPVISELPTDDDALELFRSSVFLTRYANFAELKRDRTVPLDLERTRRYAAARAAEAAKQAAT
jgi:hypothetical protein